MKALLNRAEDPSKDDMCVLIGDAEELEDFARLCAVR